MFIHLKYESEIVTFVIEFEKNCFITAFDVLERVRYNRMNVAILNFSAGMGHL